MSNSAPNREARTCGASSPAYAIVTAAHNEGAFIGSTIQAVASQTLLPQKWVIVSDASVDDTDRIVQEYAERHPFIQFVRMDKKHGHSFASKVYALHAGLANLNICSFDFICILDADVSFDASYFASLMDKFARDSALGIAGGFIYEKSAGEFKSRSTNRVRSVAGAIQLFRRECFQAVGEFPPLEYGGEDWCAEIKARMNGWRVEAFPELVVFHHKPTGAAAGGLKSRYYQGQRDYLLGSNPFFEIFKCVRRLPERPFVLGALARFIAFFSAYFCGQKRLVPGDVAEYLSREQKARIRMLLTKPFMSIVNAHHGERITGNVFSRALWHLPGRFGIARVFGPADGLRCVVFHDISAAPSSFTKGLKVSTTADAFEAKLKFLVRHYTPIRLQDVLADADGTKLPRRAVLVTFDDAYASVFQTAAPLLAKYNVPAVFFVNAAFLDNRRMAPDNLVCHVANTMGLAKINEAIREVKSATFPPLTALSDVFSRFFPAITRTEKADFLVALVHLTGIDEQRLVQQARLYLSTVELASLALSDFEIGNHTFSHVHCRRMSADDFREEIDRNQAELTTITRRPVRSFSIPYGASADFTHAVGTHLQRTGHEAVFLSESVANNSRTARSPIDRVSPRARTDDAFFLELEVLPRLRLIRNRQFRRSASGRADWKPCCGPEVAPKERQGCVETLGPRQPHA